MGFDSRRWTGRYTPGEMPPEFAGVSPYRSHHLRWWLLIAVILSIGLAVAQLWMPDGDNGGLPFFGSSSRGR